VAVRSAILATAWLLVVLFTIHSGPTMFLFIPNSIQERWLSQADRASADGVFLLVKLLVKGFKCLSYRSTVAKDITTVV